MNTCPAITPKLHDMIDPSTLSDLCEVWGWEMGGFGERQVTLDASHIPASPGEVITVYGDPRCWVIDLAWGPYNTAGSIRATYRIEKSPA